MKCRLEKSARGPFELNNSDLFVQIHASDTKNENKYNIVTLTKKKKNGIGYFFSSYYSSNLNWFKEF